MGAVAVVQGRYENGGLLLLRLLVLEGGVMEGCAGTVWGGVAASQRQGREI